MNLNKLMKLARKLALKSTHPKHKMSCIVFKHNTILSFGCNAIKTHPRSFDRWKMLHAELDSILNVDAKDLDGASVLVYRERRSGGPGLAKPCPSCEKMLSQLNIKKVFYTTENDLKSYEL